MDAQIERIATLSTKEFVAWIMNTPAGPDAEGLIAKVIQARGIKQSLRDQLAVKAAQRRSRRSQGIRRPCHM